MKRRPFAFLRKHFVTITTVAFHTVEVLFFATLVHVVARIAWMHSSTFANMNIEIDTTCLREMMTYCVTIPERTFWNYNPDFAGLIGSHAWPLLGLIVGLCIPTKVPKKPEETTKEVGEPYVNDDPQMEISKSPHI